MALNNEVSELQAELFANKTKQEELLLFTSRLTEKNIEMKSENQALEEKLKSVQADYDRLADEHERLKATLASDREVGALYSRLLFVVVLLERLAAFHSASKGPR